MPAARGSGSAAMRSARAKALNMVSHWWCALSPRRLSMCSVTWAWLTKPWKNSCTRSTSNSPISARVNLTWYYRPGPAGEIDHHARQRLVERHVGMAVAAHAGLVADRLGDRLAERDADVLDRVVRVDVQVALGLDLEVDHAVARHLVEHVLEERQAGGELRHALAVQVEPDADLRFLGVARRLRRFSFTAPLACAASSIRFSSGVPTVMRRQFSSCGCRRRSSSPARPGACSAVE